VFVVNKTVFVLVASAIAAALGEPAMAEEETAIFAGGCFWCMEKDFEHVDGVKDVVSGYIGGTKPNPSYRDHEGHVEAVRITYDGAKISYDELLQTFWRSIDPTDDGGQFCDRGHSYTTAIFALNDKQLNTAQSSKAALEMSGKLPGPVVTPILPATTFTVAEDYHQDYYKKNPLRYAFYRKTCGRDARIDAIWGEEAHAGINYGS
jgi:peptide-methionine (S)-S-oxide reductase